jgi:protoporphyrinogen oxidase
LSRKRTLRFLQRMRSNNSSATDRVAIIGAGIAGSAAAYFAHAAFGSDLSVVVFEQSAQIGGRIRHRPFAGSIVERGATLMHSSNLSSGRRFV